ncbi:hypothetical protein Dxin01_03492 [Deinococcus xinjiangensis]|uniref:Uncharacterized protein n=1 Tax=Deinococcus xinjiangensis TaxID=457454 RepID=A0ABP9VES1_9DEIO
MTYQPTPDEIRHQVVASLRLADIQTSVEELQLLHDEQDSHSVEVTENEVQCLDEE